MLSLAPYFAEEVRKYLAETYGFQTVSQRGLRAYTTLNLEMQEAAVQALSDGLEAYDRRHGWRGVETNVKPKVQGALVAIDNASGEIKAMVGGHDFGRSKFNRATQAYRQPGSAFKPFVYTLALEEGMTPKDLVEDAPISFPNGGTTWSPRNYDGKFEGPIPLRRAFARSRNVPAVRLANRFGIEEVLRTARRFGITSPALAPYLPVALGAAEVTLLEMTSAYSTFGNDGVRVTPRYLRKVTDYEGATQEEQLVEVSDVVSREIARTMVALLQSVVAEGTARRARALERAVAGKTGTTNDYTDAWFIGLTPSLTCGVWVGFDQKRSLGRGETGGRAALPIWIEFVRQATRQKASEEFPSPTIPDA